MEKGGKLPYTSVCWLLVHLTGKIYVFEATKQSVESVRSLRPK